MKKYKNILLGLVIGSILVLTIGAAYDRTFFQHTLVFIEDEPFLFEGATDDAYELTLFITDPTADMTVTLPDGGSGTLLVPTYLAYSSSGDIDADECWGGVLTNQGATGDIVLNLPEAIFGMQVTFTLIVASDVDLNAASGDQILVLTDATADAISSAATAGNSVTLFAIDATYWVPVSIDGSWADSN